MWRKKGAMVCKVWYDKAEVDVQRKATEMSRLEDLIRELCPDGVEYKKLGEFAEILRSKVVNFYIHLQAGIFHDIIKNRYKYF